ncbi:MAG: hypothetical protein Q9222_006426 [Ikaeria aurantiellina]
MKVDIDGKEEGGKKAVIKVIGMLGKYVPPGVMGTMNEIVNAVPPTNGWMVELGYRFPENGDFNCGYRDTLLIPELSEIPTRYSGQNINLMLIHLGGTTIPSPFMPLPMDAEQGVGLVRLVNPDVTIPDCQYGGGAGSDYDVFLSPLADFRQKMREAGFGEKVIYLDRKDEFRFHVK